MVSNHKCHESSAHTQFLRTREEAGTKGTVLARHLIQSFLPGEATPEMAHRIGLELCKKILSKENNLSVIDEHYESFKKKYKVNGKSWYENEQTKKGTSWKSRLQFDIDRIIKQSQDWDEFLKKMAELGYEIKHGKHIAFKPKDKLKFTRAKTIGEDYTEERLKERIAERETIKTPPVKKRIGNIIDMNTNAKVKKSKGYEYWATKHNMNTMAESVIFIREPRVFFLKNHNGRTLQDTKKLQNLHG